MKKTTVILMLVVLCAPLLAAAGDPTPERAREILRSVPLIDGHNDLPWQYQKITNNHLSQVDLRSDTSKLKEPLHTDIPRLKRGGMGGQFWSVYVDAKIPGAEAVQKAMEQIDVVKRFTAQYPDVFEMAYTAADVERIHKSGKIASLMGLEGGHCINNSLPLLREMFDSGIRYMTLTHSINTLWADSATDAPTHNGLTPFGEQVVLEMNRLGMLVDLSHVSEATMNSVLDIAKAPVIFSHSSARGINPHVRNVPDAVVKRMTENGGVIMVNFVPSFLSDEIRQYGALEDAETARLESLWPGDPDKAKALLEEWKKAHPTPRATLQQVADHIDHIRKIAGIDHIGIGSDFDGITSTPVGLEDVSTFPALLAELMRRGYSEEDIRKIAGLNALRVMRKAEQVAAGLQKETIPSDARIEDLDKATEAPTQSN